MAYLPKGVPLPAPSVDDAGFWEAARRHELVVQRCSECGTYRHTPAPVCYHCQSLDFEWIKVSGKAKVWSYINVDYPAHPALRDRVPFNIAVVELDDVPNEIRMIGNVIDTPFEELYIGMPVEVTFEDIDEETTLPQWKRAQS